MRPIQWWKSHMMENSQTNNLKLQVIILPNRFPIEGRKGEISIKIIPLNDISHKKFEAAASLFMENVRSAEITDEPITIDLSKGEHEGNFLIRYPTCTAAAIRFYVMGLGDNDELLDENEVNHNYKTTEEKFVEIPIGTRYVNRPIKVYSWFELILFLFAGMSTIGAICEVISLWKSFQ